MTFGTESLQTLLIKVNKNVFIIISVGEKMCLIYKKKSIIEILSRFLSISQSLYRSIEYDYVCFELDPQYVDEDVTVSIVDDIIGALNICVWGQEDTE